MRLRFAIPVFLGSALLFCVQPMLGRALLPLFGGTASVWTVCLVAYQALLVAGSVYADRMGRKGGRGRRVAHVALLAASCLWTLAFARFRLGLAVLVPDGGDATREMGAALLCVLAAIGLPYVILSAGSTLVQKWAEESLGEGRETYRLYVVSNIGSFAGLLAYPLAIEPFVPQTWQWRGFAAGIALYAALCAAAGIRLRQVGSQKSKVESPSANPEPPIPNPVKSDAQIEAGRPKISHLPSPIYSTRAARGALACVAGSVHGDSRCDDHAPFVRRLALPAHVGRPAGPLPAQLRHRLLPPWRTASSPMVRPRGGLGPCRPHERNEERQ